MKIERDGIDSLLSTVFLFTGDAERCDRGFIVYVSDSESYTSLYKAAEEDDSKSPHDNGSLISPSYLRIMCMSFNLGEGLSRIAKSIFSSLPSY
jgi:hypothetical protein